MDIELIFTLENDKDEDDITLNLEQLRKAKELLEKIKKYGMFNEQGEWIDENT